MKKHLFSILVAAFISIQSTFGFDVSVLPAMGFPLGEDAKSFASGFGSDASVNFPLPFAPVLSLGPTVGYFFLPVKDEYTTVSLFKGGAEASFTLPVTPWFLVSLSAGGGYYHALMNDPDMDGGTGWFSGGAGFSFRLWNTLDLGLFGGYRSFLGMYQDIYASANVSINFKGNSRSTGSSGVRDSQIPKPELLNSDLDSTSAGKVSILETKLDTVFPVFYAWYDNNPIGTVVIENTGTNPVENLKASFFVESFMDNPKSSTAMISLKPGEKAEIPVFALFNNKMMEVSEGTKASYRLTLEYSENGLKKIKEQVETLSMYDRNSMTWDDDRKAAIFVTAKDQSVLSFAKNVASMASANSAIDENLRIAMVIHEALRLYGMNYIVDPASAYTDLSKSDGSVDFLQFPRQTLEFKSGDCDDLSILYCALLEAVNVETAFLTVPGHIYVAFALKSSPEETRKKYLKADEFIFVGEKVWVPVEITMTKEPFLQAWQKGAEEWIVSDAKQQAAIFPVREAWAVYKPVGFPGSFNLALPEREKIASVATTEMGTFVSREIAPRVVQFKTEIASSQESPKVVNKLGVLYAQYGMYDEASKEFERAVSKQDFAPAFMNLGNLAFQKNDMQNAGSWYFKAVTMEPNNPKAVLAMARVTHEQENYGDTKKYYATLLQIGSDLAQQFSYLGLKGDEAKRAADIGQTKNLLIWED